MDTQNFDLSNCTRNGLHLVLRTAKSEIESYLNAKDKVEKKRAEIEEMKKKEIKKQEKRKILFSMILDFPKVFIITCIICLIMGLSNKSLDIEIKKIMLLVILPCITIGVLILILIRIRIKVKEKQRKNNLQIEIEKLDGQLPDLQKKIEEASNKFNAFLLIPYDYCSTYAMTTMLNFIDNKRADTWKEVTALYEEHIHRSKMENNARITAENSILQAEYARQNRNAARWAAAGAWATAAGVWRD